MRSGLIFMFVAASLTLKAQLIDSIPEILQGRKSIDARLESRYSFVDHQLISVNGVRLGVVWERRLRAGIGVSWLDTPVSMDLPSNSDLSATRNLKFAYFCSYVDVVFHKTKRWQLSVPLQLGTGITWFQRDADYTIKSKEPKYLLLLYEPGITAQFKVFKWFGLGTDVAYRFAWNAKRDVRGALNSPTYSFKILFWPEFLFFDLFPESEITKRFGPSYW